MSKQPNPPPPAGAVKPSPPPGPPKPHDLGLEAMAAAVRAKYQETLSIAFDAGYTAGKAEAQPPTEWPTAPPTEPGIYPLFRDADGWENVGYHEDGEWITLTSYTGLTPSRRLVADGVRFGPRIVFSAKGE